MKRFCISKCFLLQLTNRSIWITYCSIPMAKIRSFNFQIFSFKTFFSFLEIFFTKKKKIKNSKSFDVFIYQINLCVAFRTMEICFIIDVCCKTFCSTECCDMIFVILQLWFWLILSVPFWKVDCVLLLRCLKSRWIWCFVFYFVCLRTNCMMTSPLFT